MFLVVYVRIIIIYKNDTARYVPHVHVFWRLRTLKVETAVMFKLPFDFDIYIDLLVAQLPATTLVALLLMEIPIYKETFGTILLWW